MTTGNNQYKNWPNSKWKINGRSVTTGRSRNNNCHDSKWISKHVDNSRYYSNNCYRRHSPDWYVPPLTRKEGPDNIQLQTKTHNNRKMNSNTDHGPRHDCRDNGLRLSQNNKHSSTMNK